MVIKKDYPYILLTLVVSMLVATAVSDPGEAIGTFALLGLFGVGVVMSIIINPKLGAYVLIIAVFTNISKHLTDAGLPGVIKPLVAITFASILIRNYYIGQIPLDRPRTKAIEISLLLFFSASIGSYLVAGDKDLAFETLFDFGKDILIIYCILFCLRKPDEWKGTITIIIVVTTILCTLGIYQIITGNFSQTFFELSVIDTAERISGSINEPNMWAQVITSVIPFIIFRILSSSSTQKILYSVFLGILITNLIYTYSRGGYLAFIISILIIAIFFTRLNLVFISSVVGLSILIIPLLPPDAVARFESLSLFTQENQTGVYEDYSFRGRTSEVIAGIQMFADHPILGIGLSNYAINYQRYAQIIGIEYRAEEREAHSLYAEMLAERGILGFLTFTALVVFLFQGLSKARISLSFTPYYDEWSFYISATQVSLITYLFAATFLHDAYIRFLWVFVAISLALIQIVYEMKDQYDHTQTQGVLA